MNSILPVAKKASKMENVKTEDAKISAKLSITGFATNASMHRSKVLMDRLLVLASINNELIVDVAWLRLELVWKSQHLYTFRKQVI